MFTSRDIANKYKVSERTARRWIANKDPRASVSARPPCPRERVQKPPFELVRDLYAAGCAFHVADYGARNALEVFDGGNHEADISAAVAEARQRFTAAEVEIRHGLWSLLALARARGWRITDPPSAS